MNLRVALRRSSAIISVLPTHTLGIAELIYAQFERDSARGISGCLILPTPHIMRRRYSQGTAYCKARHGILFVIIITEMLPEQEKRLTLGREYQRYPQSFPDRVRGWAC